MTNPPARPKIYHITHVDNLAAIAAEGCLVSDAVMLERGGPVQTIGMSSIKRRRVEVLEVGCHPGSKVGDYVPFYFCPRSVMLYVIHCRNHPELAYRGGQDPIVHLEADLHTVVHWVEAGGGRWAFSLSNAGAYYSEFRSRLGELDQLNWAAIAAHDFRRPEIKEGKQAEFLVHGRFPFELIEHIGVRSAAVLARAVMALSGLSNRAVVEVRPEWYFPPV
ncbi:MAG: type II toxin-antitoxin system toxin DNA ADP-ribosyl transferase DarT [Thermoanaerobaculia bacterium]